MRPPILRAFAAAIAALLAIGCSRGSGYGLVQPAVAAPLSDAETGAVSPALALPPVPAGSAAPATSATSGPRGPVGRRPVPIVVDGQSASGAFAPLAPPSADHPRGTLAVLRAVFVPDHARSLGGTGTDDVDLAEVDLATATPLRRVSLGHGITNYDLAVGASGAVLFVQSRAELTLAWVDAAFAIVARRSLPDLGSDRVRFCAFTGVGERAVLAGCGDGSDRTRVWVFDARSERVERSCAGENVNSLIELTPWGDRAVVTGIAVRKGSGKLVCAFRVDGRGGVATGSYALGASVFAAGGALYATNLSLTDYDFHVVGDDLRPARQGVADPRAPEVVAAERLQGYASWLQARLVAGLVVLRARHCCGESGPGLYLFDPHADE
jgi:hypothetical protein